MNRLDNHTEVLFRSLSFIVKIGGSSGCDSAESGEDVVVEYKTERSSTGLSIITLQHDGTCVRVCPNCTIAPFGGLPGCLCMCMRRVSYRFDTV